MFTLQDARDAKERAEKEGERRQSPYVDSENQRIRPDTTAESIEDQYLSVREGTNLREEVVTCKGRATTWADAVDTFEDYIWRQWKAADTWQQDQGITPTSHRFTEKASKDRYGRTLGVDRAAQELWDDDLTTVHVVRRARAFGENGQPQPPADHLHDLLSGNRNVYSAYQRHIEDNHGLQYARLSVVEPHNNGYGHIHDGLWVNDPENVLGELDILPAVDSHLRAVEQAQPRYHGPNAVSVRHDPEGKRLESDPVGVPVAGALPRELVKYLGGLAPHGDGVTATTAAPNVVQADRGPLRFYALLWATGACQWRPDRGLFQYFVKLSQDWYEGGDDDSAMYVDPEDIDVDSENTTATVDIRSRPTAFQPFDGRCP